jgi:outer membrane protein OmpA-like peptidoglycan-associated protein
MRHTRLTLPSGRQQIDLALGSIPLRRLSVNAYQQIQRLVDWHDSCTFDLVRVESKRKLLGGFTVNLARVSKLSAFLCAIATFLITSSAFAVTPSKTRQFAQGEKAKVSGVILSRDGDLIRARDKKSREVITVSISDATHVERKNHRFPFYRRTEMDVTALLPGLTIEAEGAGNSNGQLDARKVSFTPDDFVIEVAQEQQVLANKTSTQNAQSTANEAAAAASTAQSTADQAQSSADQAALQAQAAGVVGLADVAAIAAVDQRVSDLDDYKIESENDVFFDRDSAILKEDAKPALADLAKVAKSFRGYLIEISGYASNTRGSKTDQKLSEERAAAVARYFYEVQNIPMRRVLMPVGYGSTHRLANNSNAEGRELNRRVDVKILVNMSLEEGMQLDAR